MTKTEKNSDNSKLLHDIDQCSIFGGYTRAARNALNLSQDDLAAMLGVTRSTLVRLEKGQAPLKIALCSTLLEVLAKAGVRSDAMSTLMDGPGVPASSIDILINVKPLLWSVKSGGVNLKDKTKHLLGTKHVPPLEKAPLRSDKPRRHKK